MIHHQPRHDLPHGPRAVVSSLLPFAFCLLPLFGLCGCHSLRLFPATADKPDKPEKKDIPVVQAPGLRSFRVGQFVFLSDFEVNRDQPLFQELAELRDQVYRELQLPPATTVIQVNLFQDRERYEQFMRFKYPDLPRRRAFFVAQPKAVGGTEDLLVYTFWGERIRQDLRHELTHALLHCVLKDVPLWLDEGLAEYFELPPHLQGVNPSHLEQATSVSAAFKPDLAHLEQLTQVQQMSPAEYRESWAWVHLLLRDKPEAKAVLLAYLRQLRLNPNPGPLEPRLAALYPDLDEALTRHLLKLEQEPKNQKANMIKEGL
jgi:hypothetical protein